MSPDRTAAVPANTSMVSTTPSRLATRSPGWPDATACWDNPITAGPHSLYLERDIQSRLNRYARDEDITDVWIWAEERTDGSYDLYIGYA